ncbi:MAG: glycyl-radical enzyme activating protein [Deltaproteobacteria bacterium]|uniref:Glycyl-radical enzyme activating protein n=1 Tax=Candidatus Zymogenus saltonus TaxID=2844893 RepID=A0A9D8KDS0_9DELT|nr:glycyl-radical enzyme activating protein [Candidatus Zymogenus saltonus]
MGIVFDIQPYSIYDGPGIRTTVFLKGCPLNCVWCHNPESQRQRPEMGYTVDKCASCGKCIEECPNGALTLMDKKVVRDYRRCAACGLCGETCPNGAHEKIGLEMSAGDIVKKVVLDKPFFDESSGGVTITGGEPTAQREFLLKIVDLLREKDIHIALETCGYFKTDIVSTLIERVDLFLFDIKHIDPEIHKTFTGVDNGLILENFRLIAGNGGSGRVIPRIPLIPGFNADTSSLKEICEFLRETKYPGPVHLMPYNRMAKSKYEKLGRGGEYRDMGELTRDMLDGCVNLLGDYGFEAVINH